MNRRISVVGGVGCAGGVEHVEEDHGVVVGACGVGVVRDEAVAGGAFEQHGLVVEGGVADLGVVEVFGAGAVGADVVALPQAGEVLALEQEFADELGEVGGIGVGAGQGPQGGGSSSGRGCVA